MFAKKLGFTKHGLVMHIKILQSLFKQTFGEREQLTFMYLCTKE